MKRWDLYEPVYRVALSFCVGDKDGLIDLLKDAGYKDFEWLNEGASGHSIRLDPSNSTFGGNAQVIWMEKFETGMMVHEIVHLMTDTMDTKGVPIREENSEAMAYYVEYWFNKITRARRKHPDGVREHHP